MTTYKLINEEPTEEMKEAGAKLLQIMSFPRTEAGFVFRAMYDAAPEVQQEHFDKFEVFVKHDKIYFAISNQSFQLAFIPEDEPDMSAGQVAEWYMDQVRHALSRLQSPDAQAEIAKLNKRIAELEERRCEICGYAEHHREHTGCLRVFVDEQSAEIARLKSVIEKCGEALETCCEGVFRDIGFEIIRKDYDSETVKEALAAIKEEGL